jgi:nucleoside-diphosphate-sugar epimerase
MRVFVTGATGFVGSAVVQELIRAGHDVLGLARSDAAARSLAKVGAKAHRGTIEDLECLRRGAAMADAAIHTAYFHAFSHASLSLRLRVMFGGLPSGIVSRFMRAAVETDIRAIETLGTALVGADPSLVFAFPTMAMKAGQVATEDDAADPNSAGGPRARSESALKALAGRGIRVSTVRLPPTVHGDGDHGLVWSLIQTARKKGFSAYVGEGRNRWGAVHRHDAARLFRLALEKGTPGSRYHAVAEEGMPFRRIAEVIGRHLDVPVVGKSQQEAASVFSFLAPFVATDNPVSSALTQQRLGWTPTGPDLLHDLEKGTYFGGAGPTHRSVGMQKSTGAPEHS